MTDVVNLYGGPGAGKSTIAAYMYYLAKKAGVNAEMVREYVKDWAWEGRSIGPFDQFYFMGKHIRKETLLYGKVQLVVTDSPVLLPVMYSRMYSPNIAPAVEDATRGYYAAAELSGNHHHHLFLRRVAPYKKEGRFQDEADALALDQTTLDLLTEFGLEHDIIDGDEVGAEQWLKSKGLI